MPTTRNIVKTWFETNDYPTQAQFWEFLESVWFKDESIPIASISDLVTILNGIDATLKQTTTFAFAAAAATKNFTIPAGFVLRYMTVESAVDQLFIAGDTVAGVELLEDVELLAGQPQDILCSVCATRAATRVIYVNCDTADFTITFHYTKFYKP